MVRATYKNARTVESTYGKTDEFNIDIGLHQGSALSNPFLFIFVLAVIHEL